MIKKIISLALTLSIVVGVTTVKASAIIQPNINNLIGLSKGDDVHNVEVDFPIVDLTGKKYIIFDEFRNESDLYYSYLRYVRIYPDNTEVLNLTDNSTFYIIPAGNEGYRYMSYRSVGSLRPLEVLEQHGHSILVSINTNTDRYNDYHRKIVASNVSLSYNGITYPPVDNSVNQKSTITINANVEPYLETSLDKTIVDFNVSALNDSTSDINLLVKSNMNYKIESKFSGLKNTDSSVTIDNSQFKLSSNSVDKPLTIDSYTLVEDNQVFGETVHTLNLALKSSQVIKADTYTGSLEFKVSQL